MMKITIPRRFALVLIALFAGVSAFAQTSTITGVVRDTAGDPVVGAAVMVKGTTNGVMTNADGSYSIRAKDDAVLVCQLFGYKNQEEIVVNRFLLVVSLVVLKLAQNQKELWDLEINHIISLIGQIKLKIISIILYYFFLQLFITNLNNSEISFILLWL